ncbi:MAG: DNA gyrase/topoisomerase IV subunit A [Bacteroidales bacterium]
MEKIEDNEVHRTLSIPGMYQNWFLDYASYVILERAVPEIMDGLKPVHRRILHSMYELDDGRYNKVANVVGHTMKYHPHGDASIGEALVQLGQKNLLIDCQGNWGNVPTGDSAAAPRYIEARLSKFALEVVFNPKTTVWKPSYDGRNKEPVSLPIKFPLLLAQGVEGIAVGLASKVLPHNFNELVDASIQILKKEDFEIYPDFMTGGYIDISNYNDGLRGGKVRIRAKISQLDKKTLVINEIPFSTTTGSLIESILKANDKGKIKIKKVDDNTAENVEIVIQLQPGVSPDTTMDALYAFTDCEISISPNACVIVEQNPEFIGVKEILRVSTQTTMNLLKQELEIRLDELLTDWHYTSLEKIFFEERIYRELEKDVKEWDDLLKAIEKAFKPFAKKLQRPILRDDIIKLTEKPVRKISKFDVKKADEHIQSLEAEMEEVRNHLAHLIEYTINYFVQLKKKYGKGRERKTEIRNFEVIQATMVAANNEKLYVNRLEGFAGTALKKDEFVCDCSDIDDMVIFRGDGSFIVTKVASKVFVGEDVIHIDIFRKNDERTIYNMVYQDGKMGSTFVKRFSIKGITRDKEYVLTQGTPGSKVLYFTANPNGEAEVIKVYLRPKPKLKKMNFDFDFKKLLVKGRASIGNILTPHLVKRIILEDAGVSTLGARKIWYDDTVQRLNVEERGQFLGDFKGDDKILCLTQSGAYHLYGFDLSTHFEPDMIYVCKYQASKIISAVYTEKKTKLWYIKRFQIEINDKKTAFIEEDANFVSFDLHCFPALEMIYDGRANKKEYKNDILDVSEFIGVKGNKAKGKRLSTLFIKNIKWLEPIQEDPIEEEKEEVFNPKNNEIQLDSELSEKRTGATDIEQLTIF